MLSINLFSLKVSERVSVSHLNVRLLKLASYTIRQFDMYLPSPGHKTHYHPTLSLRYNTRMLWHVTLTVTVQCSTVPL